MLGVGDHLVDQARSPSDMISPRDGGRASEDRTMLAVEIPLIILAIGTVVLRVYSRVRVKRKLAADDILIVCAIGCAFARTIISCMGTSDTFNFDKDGPETTAEIPYYRHIFERRIAYILAILFTRLSVLSYYRRIFPVQISTLRFLTIGLIMLAVAHCIGVITVLSVLCNTVSKLWSSDWLSFNEGQCFSSPIYSYSAAVGDAFVDTLIFLLPVPYCWGLSKLRARQRLGLILVFGLGFLVCVVALLQIPFIRKREEYRTYFGGSINLLVAIQISLAIIAASLPDLRALVARSFPHFSPLHHRSWNTGARDCERGRRHVQRGDSNTPEPRPALEVPRSSMWKPDWLRQSLPGSLMETRVTETELSRANTRVVARDIVGVPCPPNG